MATTNKHNGNESQPPTNVLVTTHSPLLTTKKTTTTWQPFATPLQWHSNSLATTHTHKTEPHRNHIETPWQALQVSNSHIKCPGNHPQSHSNSLVNTLTPIAITETTCLPHTTP